MLHFIIALHILCFVPGNAFPQRNKPDSESQFDFEAYLRHFAPIQHTVNDHPRFLPNQDYRYIPLLGERPDYIPPIIHRGHIPHPNIPREVKHRAWHSNYQNGNFPTPAIEHAKKSIQGQNVMQTHKRQLHQPVTEISMPNRNFNFHIHSKMVDFGDYEAPVILESIEKEIPVFRQQDDDYDIPVVLESIIRKHTPNPIKQNNHKKPVSAVPSKEKQVVKDFDSKKPIFIDPSPDEDYEEPVVVEAVVKGNPISKGPSHKMPENYPSGFADDYDVPIVLEALTKVHKRHDHKKPTKAKPVKQNGHTDSIVKPVDELVFSSYQEYEAPVVLEEFTKESAHIKGHDKLVKEKPLKKQYVANTIDKPVGQNTVSRFSEDYESPIVIAFHKEESHPNFVQTNEQDHESKIETQSVAKKQEKVVIAISAEKPVVTSYTEDEYEEPIVVEALTKEELFHNEHGNKKSSVIKPEKPKANEGEKVIGSKEESITEEYGYEELEHFTIHGEDEYYDSIVVGSEMQRNSGDYDSEDYDYEDSTMIEDPTRKGEQQTFKEHGHNSVIARPSNIPVPSIDQGIYEISKEMPKSSVTKETKKRVKREINVDYEDYELPIILESIVKHPTDPKEHGSKPSGDIKSESEQDYEAPIVLESIVKGSNLVTEKHTRTKPAKVDAPKIKHPIDYYDYEEPVVLESIKKPGLASGHKSATEGPTDYDYETPIVIASFTKEQLGHKPAVKSEIKRILKPVENSPIEKTSAYIRNKREREQHMELSKLVNSIVRQEAYGRPIDEVANHGYELNAPQRPHDYFDEWESVPEGNPISKNSGSLGNLDNQIVLDSITINREHPDGHEIPFLEVLAVENTDGGPENGVKVMSFNQENGDVDAFNLGHVDSNVDIAELGDQGSGSVIDERSVSRNFLPLDSNSWSFMNHIQAQERRKFKRCFTPKNETGNCMPVQMCPVPNAGNTVDDFLKNVCIIDDVFIGICCPEFPVETVRVDWGQFGSPDTEPLVDDEEESKETKECGKLSSTVGDKDSWPWMAPLVSSTSDKVFCGGALVTEHYVLTAAHCTSKIPRNQILVRLGNPDSRQNSRDFAVVEIKRHAQYNPRTMQNDIALLKLSRKVPLGNFRKLICLPDSEEDDHVGETAALLRWQGIAEKGATESLPVISNQDCQNGLSTIIGGSVLCTSTRNEEVMCNADSGAPLVISKDGQFKIIGVLTWNRNDCDGRFPTVFTRISSYRKWILTHAA